MKKPVKHKHKPVTKAKVHRKPVRVTPKIAAARHAAALKAAKTRAANAKKHKARTLALGEGVACCSAEALAASLRLAGGAVSDDDVLALHWLAGGDVDTGVPILAALDAASVYGLAGYRPVGFAELTGVGAWRRLVLEPQSQLKPSRPCPATAWDWLDFARTFRDLPWYRAAASRQPADVILGVDLPGPHAVLAEPGRWWSWGEPYDPAIWPDAIIEEAWTIEWG